MSDERSSSRRELLTTTAGIGGLLAFGATAALGQDREGQAKAPPPTTSASPAGLVKMAAPRGQRIEAREGSADQLPIQSVVSVASKTFEFKLGDGDTAEKTAAVNKPPGAGFIVMLIDLYYAFVNTQGGNSLTERPLGQFVADVGMRGDNLACRVRLTDSNADDPVTIYVTCGVLFFK